MGRSASIFDRPDLDFSSLQPSDKASSTLGTTFFFITSVMAPGPEVSQKITEAQSLSKPDPQKAEKIYKDILSKGPETGDASLHTYEAALIGLGKLYRDTNRPSELAELVRTSRSTLSSFAKAKTAKLGTG